MRSYIFCYGVPTRTPDTCQPSRDCLTHEQKLQIIPNLVDITEGGLLVLLQHTEPESKIGMKTIIKKTSYLISNLKGHWKTRRHCCHQTNERRPKELSQQRRESRTPSDNCLKPSLNNKQKEGSDNPKGRKFAMRGIKKKFALAESVKR